MIYVSRSLTESNNAQTEKEALAATECFPDYILGKHIEIYKPLVSLFDNKNLDAETECR